MKTKEITTENAQQTRKIAEKFMNEILAELADKTDKKSGKDRGEKAVLICLRGDLGSGKTVFAQGVAKTLGIKETVNSPTFLIMKKYELPGLMRGRCLYHFDLYRIKEKQEILNLGWKEILENKNNIVIVEWPEKVEEILLGRRIDVGFSTVSENVRRLTFHFL